MGFVMLKSSQAQITQLKNYLIVFSVTYKSYVKSSEFCIESQKDLSDYSILVKCLIPIY